jgi:hypothetical protein
MGHTQPRHPYNKNKIKVSGRGRPLYTGEFLRR